MTRRSQSLVVVVGWLLSIVLLVLVFVRYDPQRLSHAGFPHMPFFGAMTWWFFFTIPVIGMTWGFFNDWKGDRR